MKNLLLPGAFCLLALAGFGYSHPFKTPDYQTALKMAREHPEDVYWLSALGNHFEKRENLSNASAIYRKCLSLEPDNSENYLRLSSVYVKMGRPDFALPVIRNAAVNFTNNAKVAGVFADVLYRMGDYSNSVFYYRRSMTIGGSTNSSYLYCGLAKSYRALKQYERSRASFRKALEIRKDLWTFYEYGKLLGETGNPEHAAWAFEKARSLAFRQPENVVKLLQDKLAEAYYSCGMKAKADGNKKAARGYFEKILNDRGLRATRCAERAEFWIRRL